MGGVGPKESGGKWQEKQFLGKDVPMGSFWGKQARGSGPGGS